MEEKIVSDISYIPHIHNEDNLFIYVDSYSVDYYEYGATKYRIGLTCRNKEDHYKNRREKSLLVHEYVLLHLKCTREEFHNIIHEIKEYKSSNHYNEGYYWNRNREDYLRIERGTKKDICWYGIKINSLYSIILKHLIKFPPTTCSAFSTFFKRRKEVKGKQCNKLCFRNTEFCSMHLRGTIYYKKKNTYIPIFLDELKYFIYFEKEDNQLTDLDRLKFNLNDKVMDRNTYKKIYISGDFEYESKEKLEHLLKMFYETRDFNYLFYLNINHYSKIVSPLLSAAVITKDIKLVKLLLERGANPNVEMIDGYAVSPSGRSVRYSYSIAILLDEIMIINTYINKKDTDKKMIQLCKDIILELNNYGIDLNIFCCEMMIKGDKSLCFPFYNRFLSIIEEIKRKIINTLTYLCLEYICDIEVFNRLKEVCK